MWWRRLTLFALAFALGTALAELLGAANLGVAIGVGTLAFAVALVWTLLR